MVVGGGIAGLAAAWELSGGAEGPRADSPRVEVIDAQDRTGGLLATGSFAGRTIDLGADGFLARRPEAVTLAREVGLGDELEPIAASGAWLWLRGAPRAMPAGIVLGVPTDLGEVLRTKGLTWRARLAARRDVLAPRRLRVGEDATIGEIVRRKLGDELTYQMVEPMIGGIQAGRIDDLSARSVFPALLDAAHRGGSLMKALRSSGPASPGPRSAAPTPSTGSVASTPGPMFYSLSRGVGSLSEALSDRLGERGVVVRRGVAVTALRRTPAGAYAWEVDTATTTTPADAIVLAAPARVAARLLGGYDAALGALGEVPSAGACMVTYSFARGDVTLPETGTGVLVPLATPFRDRGSFLVTALTFLDRKWPRLARAEDVLFRAHVGRSDDLRWSEMSDEELVARVNDELSVLLGRTGEPLAVRVQRWPDALPQYRVGHSELVARARSASATLNVALAGSAYDGVGVPASIGSGRRGAREALATLTS